MVYNKEILGERERERDFDEARDIGRERYIYIFEGLCKRPFLIDKVPIPPPIR